MFQRFNLNKIKKKFPTRVGQNFQLEFVSTRAKSLFNSSWLELKKNFFPLYSYKAYLIYPKKNFFDFQIIVFAYFFIIQNRL